MAAMGYTEWLLFASKWQHTNDFGNKWYVLNLKNANLIWYTIKMFICLLPFYNMVNIDTDKQPSNTIKGLLYIDDLDQKFYIFNVEWIYRIE